jgi:hypothetical protein
MALVRHYQKLRHVDQICAVGSLKALGYSLFILLLKLGFSVLVQLACHLML